MVIWSVEHAAYWGPGSRGYTEHLEDAGRYTQAEADAIVADANITGRINELAIHDSIAEHVEADIARTGAHLRRQFFALIANHTKAGQ